MEKITAIVLINIEFVLNFYYNNNDDKVHRK